MKVSMRWQGANSFENRLANAAGDLKEKVAKAMTEVVSKTHDEAVKLTPRDTGKLQESSVGRVGGQVVSQGKEFSAEQTSSVNDMGNTLTGVVAFRTDYAVEQHETLHYNHPKGGESKFLEKASVARKEANLDLLRRV